MTACHVQRATHGALSIARPTSVRALSTPADRGRSRVGASAGRAPATTCGRSRTGATITINGHGYGHGHGMSQYGAEGAARQGLTLPRDRRVLLPGHRVGDQRAAGSRCCSPPTPPTTWSSRRAPGLTVRDTGGRKTRVALPDNGATALAGRRRRRRRQPGVATGRARLAPWRTLKGEGEFYAGGDPITLVDAVGRARLPRPAARRRDVRGRPGHRQRRSSLESYLKGVVPLEIPASWSAEAVRAQAVAARTYASYERQHPRRGTTRSATPRPARSTAAYDAEHPASNRADRRHRRQILTSGGEPAFTQFGSSSGGWTSAGSVPYLPAKQDPYDDWSGNPVHDWTVKVDDTRASSGPGRRSAT